jgi:hypothetical protein
MEIAQRVKAESAILDGEIVCLGESANAKVTGKSRETRLGLSLKTRSFRADIGLTAVDPLF